MTRTVTRTRPAQRAGTIQKGHGRLVLLYTLTGHVHVKLRYLRPRMRDAIQLGVNMTMLH